MASFIAEVSRKKIFKTALYPVVKKMLTDLAPYTPLPLRFPLSNLWLFGGIIKAVVPKINSQASSMLGTTFTFTDIKGSTRDKECTSTAYFRFIEEADFKADLEKFKKIAE